MRFLRAATIIVGGFHQRKKSRRHSASQHGCVEIRGARQNNLKGFDLDLPLGKLTVVTGPSGSGKSSLAFETIYAEGQRRYVETFSPYTRQFLERMDKPRVDEIRGIPPAIAIEQSNPVKSSRSTVGTMTEINDYLKLLMPRLAQAFCPSCGREIRPETAKSIADQIAAENASRTGLITFWVAIPAKTEADDFFAFLQQQGYLRVWLNGEIVRADQPAKKLRLGARVQVIQDRLTIARKISPGSLSRSRPRFVSGKTRSTSSISKRRRNLRFRPAGIAPIAISTFARRRPASSVLTIR